MRAHATRIFLAAMFTLLVGATAAQAHGNPVIHVDPTIVAAGGVITAKGSQMEPDLEFTITLERVGNAITLGMVTARKDNPAAQDAVFSQAFAIPPDAKPGSYQVRATSPDGDTASADLTVTEPTAAATAGAAMERMASGELQVLDRSKPLAETVGFAVVAAIAGVAGVWLARRSDA
ncbi:MAG TPA: hypothetical protein VIN63_00610 [Candidatus Limnocylindria bacterium]|jgi:hypothetical protein|nr:hypothetical protein [Chloroflexota bacterium]